jgi:hypothetical protein
MTDLTSRELFDAIERSLRRTGQRFLAPKKGATKKSAKGPMHAAKSKTSSKKSSKTTMRRRSRA